MGFFYSQFFKKPGYPKASFAGKTVIVTGANTGLGKEAARHFVRLGASRLIIAVRSLDKGHDARRDIETTTRCGKGLIQVWELDMASYESVKRFAARVTAELDRVDNVIANAALASFSYNTAEGNELQVTVNVISTFLLMALVMPKLKETAAVFNTRPVFTMVSSDAHTHTTFSQGAAPEGKILDTVNDKNVWSKHQAEQYPVSKLLGLFTLRAIAEKHPAPLFPVTINAANPGLCHSALSREAAGSQAVFFFFFKLFVARSTEVGSRTEVNAAAAGVETHGQYLVDNCEIGSLTPLVTGNKKLQDRVAAEVFARLEVIEPGVTKNF
ncbi:putative short-chain dehydrogenase [Cryphonectria parasitica EP155]|uniref:Short-chain dehydrogenase n=1 Tax=Cryphonectria parasitica (strain ATCC 38755 / EP155) TaxID=660469 RepID=A0A9P5CPV0_CRYP1|nr:putative short-chain dehydrogenase [Cryphonectria parasitica EP155]KAF3766563.1 putative short-chain dehydrogenase [Cryphonectria parasitica EP155]